MLMCDNVELCYAFYVGLNRTKQSVYSESEE